MKRGEFHIHDRFTKDKRLNKLVRTLAVAVVDRETAIAHHFACGRCGNTKKPYCAAWGRMMDRAEKSHEKAIWMLADYAVEDDEKANGAVKKQP